MLSFRQRVGLLTAGAATAMAALSVVVSPTASAATTRYEAEAAPAVCTGTIDTNWTGYTGTGFCNGNNAIGAAAQFTVTATTTGTATITIRYANGTTTNRPADILINGTTTHPTTAFNPTGTWTTWTTTTLTIPINNGNNTIRLNPTTTNGLPNIDHLDLDINVSPSPSPSLTRYEAETAPAVCTGTIDANWTGYTGTGFCNGNNAVGAYVQFTVDASSAGSATLGIRYANGATTARPADLIVNGSAVQNLSFEGTGAWNTWATKTVTARVNAGSNTIRLSPTSANGLPNVDYLEVSVGGVSPSASTSPPPGRPPECTGTSPVTCRFGVSPGNYTVTAWIGDRASAGNTSMSVEARRRILPAVSTAAGTITRYVFTINVRQPEGQPTGQGGTGNPGLTVTFAGSAPKLSGLTVQAASNPLVVYLAGDSTVCDQMISPYTGWGQILPTHVGAGAVIANYGDSGESSGSFLSNSALFPTMRPLIRSGDLVLIQFGHNDKQTSASSFRSNLTSMINQVRDRGGVPVLVTPPVRRQFNGSQLTPTALHVNGVGVNLPAEMRSLGSALNVPVIDLTAKSEVLVESLGPTNSAQLYLRQSVDGVTDNTHFSEYGAGRMAELVVQGIRERNLSLVSYLR